MNRRFLLFQGYKEKAFTLSYDDAVWQDKKLVSSLIFLWLERFENAYEKYRQ